MEGLFDDVKKTIEGLKGVVELEAKVPSGVQSDHKTPARTTSLFRFLAIRLS